MKSDLIITLSERGFINQATNLEGLDALADMQKITSYIGFDLTADSLHVGSLIQIMVLRWMTRLGHNPIVLFGEATTRIGDPSGKTTSRPMLTDEQIEHNRIGIKRVIDRLVGGYTHIPHVSNAEWFSDNGPSFMGFLSEYGRHFTINRMLTFDSVKSRLDRKDPMTFLEFNYMLMQAIDFLKLHEREDCVLQIGGSDQWGNIINGVELTRRIAKTEVFGLTTPLMTNTAGEKMGKTASGAIWLDPDKTSAFEFFQFWRNVEDAKVGTFLKLFTELHMDEILPAEKLPLRYAGYSSCFRREAGTYGKDTRGIIRVHQFDKVEMFSFCKPEEAKEEHKRLLQWEKDFLTAMEIPFRVIDVASGDLGSSAVRKFDIEAWIPTQGAYREVTSTSNCTEFQARRLNIRYKDAEGTKAIATLNGTLVAIPRMIVAILENHQNADGTVNVPAALQPFLGMKKFELV